MEGSNGSLRNLWEQAEYGNTWLWMVATVTLAIFLHLAYHRLFPLVQSGQLPHEGASLENSLDATNVTNGSMHESRLLRKQFGVIPDDLDLYLEDEIINENAASIAEQHQTFVDPPQPQRETDDGSCRGPQVQENEAVHSEDDIVPKNNELSTKIKTQAIKRSTKTQSIRERLASAAEARLQQQPPPFRRISDSHPGLRAFWYWCDVETSLFRIYTVTRKDGVQDESTTPPYNPSSRRGNVAIKLRVTNCLQEIVKVYWINFKGAHVEKGTIPANGGTWRQTTWIDHPWTFCTGANIGDEKILLHYIPYRVIPTLTEASTVDNDDEDDSGRTGVHRFRILPNATSDSIYSCAVDDPILPHPANRYISTPRDAAEFALLHCVRVHYNGWNVLKKCIRMIIQHPENPRFRQVRTSNKVFAEAVWNTPAKGVLLAAGFEEHGAYVELGSVAPLSPAVIQELSELMISIEHWEKLAEDPEIEQQPEGFDGYGRAGFGR